MGQNTSKRDKKLMKEYNLTKEDLDELKTGFEEKCNGGRGLTKAEFREVYGGNFDGDSEQFADEMFRVADADNDGRVDFLEFVRYLCSCDSKNIDDKIKIAFNLFDKDNSGTISRTEVRDVIKAYSKLENHNQQSKKKLEEDGRTDDFASDFFRKMDEDENDEVTFEEFSEAAKRDPNILNILTPRPPE